jgi:hypothetical protein
VTEPDLSAAADVRRRLLSIGERLGWQFRDRHRFWRHWTVPPPTPALGPDRLVRNFLFAGAIGIGVYVTGVFAVLWVRPAHEGVYVLALWLIFVLPVAAYPLVKHGTRTMSHRRRGTLVERWERERDVHNTAERARVDAIDEWGAVRTLPGTRRIDVFGGEYHGWASFLTTFGCSMLAEEAPVIVLDLSQVAVSAELCHVAEQAGVDCRVEHLPDQAGVSTLLEGLSPADLKDVLVEAIHGDRPEHDRHDRLLDDRILAAVCGALRPHPTLPRIHEALRCLLREPGLSPVHLGPDELERVAALFADEHQSRMHDRLQRLEAYLAHISELQSTERAAPAAGAKLTCFSVTQSGSQVVTELVVDLLGQWLIRSLKNVRPGQGRRTVVVVGADSLKARHLERVSALCDSLDFRLVLLFQHLRDAGSALLGGGRATIFMRLGNYEEAERAANFIGRGYRFELARITTGHGGSDTTTRSTSRTGESFVPWSRRWGSSRSREQSTSWSYAETSQRVHELFVEPTHLQSLPPTAFVLVQHMAGQRVLAVAADCDPDIASLPRVSMQPLAEPPAVAEPQLESPTFDARRALR